MASPISKPSTLKEKKDRQIHEKFVDSVFVKTCDELIIDATNIAGSAILP